MSIQTTATDPNILPVLKGQRIYLRPVTMDDVNDTYRTWLNDPLVNQYLEIRFSAQTPETIAAFVREKINRLDEPFFAICLKEDDRHIGNIKLGPVNPHHLNADVSLFIGEKSCWGKGYAPEAIRLVTAYAFETLHLNKLRAGCYKENEGSARAFEKCGYQREGLLKGYLMLNGRETDLILLGLRAADYQGTGS